MKKRLVNIIVKGNGKLPYYATEKAAGADLYAANEEPVILEPNQRALIMTDLFIELPEDSEAQIRPRSGLAVKYGVTVLNSPGTIDADYQGNVGVPLINLGQETFVVQKGERIAQMVLNGDGGLFQAEWVRKESFERESQRAAGGFGHTGMK